MLQCAMRNLNSRLEECVHRKKSHLHDVIYKFLQFRFPSLKWQDVMIRFFSISCFFFDRFLIFLLGVPKFPVFLSLCILIVAK